MRNDQWTRQRATFLGILLTTMISTAFLALLFIACGGLTLYILIVPIGMSIFAFLHYLWWGRSLDHQVAGEREEDRIRDSLESMQDLDDQGLGD
jgi:hypothetical protein